VPDHEGRVVRRHLASGGHGLLGIAGIVGPGEVDLVAEEAARLVKLGRRDRDGSPDQEAPIRRSREGIGDADQNVRPGAERR
jgi:hypothetical protein